MSALIQLCVRIFPSIKDVTWIPCPMNAMSQSSHPSAPQHFFQSALRMIQPTSQRRTCLACVLTKNMLQLRQGQSQLDVKVPAKKMCNQPSFWMGFLSLPLKLCNVNTGSRHPSLRGCHPQSEALRPKGHTHTHTHAIEKSGGFRTVKYWVPGSLGAYRAKITTPELGIEPLNADAPEFSG